VKAYGINEAIIEAETNPVAAGNLLQEERLEDEPGN
jgi:hypothetical protein